MPDQSLPPVPRLRPGAPQPRLRPEDQAELRKALELKIWEMMLGARIQQQSPEPAPPKPSRPSEPFPWSI